MRCLTDLKIRTLSPSAKEQTLNDGDGLYLRMRASSKSWLHRDKSGTKQIKIGLGASYDRATFLAQRKVMVQQWADFLDELEAGKMPMLAANVNR